MVALDAALAIPKRVNGYHHHGLGSDRVVSPQVEPLAETTACEEPQNRDAPAAPNTTADAASQGHRTTSAADKVKPAQKKSASQTRHTTSTVTKAKKTKKTKSAGRKTRYVPQAELDAEQAKLESLSQAVLAGDTTALDKLRSKLDNCPHIYRRLADLQLLIEHKLIALVSGYDPSRVEAFRKHWSELRHNLLDGEPSSLATKMAASRLVTCWLFIQVLELRALESPDELRNIKSLEQAQRRFHVAMRTFTLAQQSDKQLQRLAQ